MTHENAFLKFIGFFDTMKNSWIGFKFLKKMLFELLTMR